MVGLTMDHHDVTRALDECLSVLTPETASDRWPSKAGVLEWTCLATAEHLAHDLLAYATQLAARPDDAYLPLDLTVRPGTAPAKVLQIITACARLVINELAAATPSTRAWHWGPTDPSGFAAIAVNETLVHTWDIAQGLNLPWQPPPDLSAAVLTRLFRHVDLPPYAPPDVLLWATGRQPLPGHPRRTEWTVRAAVPQRPTDPAPAQPSAPPSSDPG
jgi:hypothetical protein